MSKKLFRAAKSLIVLCLAGIMSFSSVSVSFAEEDSSKRAVQSSNFILKQAVKTYAQGIADNFYYGIDDEELLYAVICHTIDDESFNLDSAVEAMIDVLEDDYAEFYTKEEFKAMTEDISGGFSGIGVTITQNSKGIVVLSVIENSPAYKAGIMEGDYITGVDLQSVLGMSTGDVRNLIVGPIGTAVTVTVERLGRPIDFLCIRDYVEVSQTETKMLTDDIAYLKLIQFSQNTPEEVEAFINELKEEKVSKLVIDLRNNPGGDLDSAHKIASAFISAGSLAQLHYKDKTQNEYMFSRNYNAPFLKIAVLVNENSASASEFLASAFQERKAAKIIGTKTYGKGSMQALSRLITGAGMKFTVGEFYSASGKRINTVGVTPDIVVENEFEKVDEGLFEKIDYDYIDEGVKGGKMTLALEQRLEAIGCLDEEPDEVYDEETKKAVMYLQNILGYEATGTPGFYEYLYLNDLSYDFDVEIDRQMDSAIAYLDGLTK